MNVLRWSDIMWCWKTDRYEVQSGWMKAAEEGGQCLWRNSLNSQVCFKFIVDMLWFSSCWLTFTKTHKYTHETVETQRTYPHDFAPLIYILPHGVHDVTAHVLSCTAFLPHPHQTHPKRREEMRWSTWTAVHPAMTTTRQQGQQFFYCL